MTVKYADGLYVSCTNTFLIIQAQMHIQIILRSQLLLQATVSSCAGN